MICSEYKIKTLIMTSAILAILSYVFTIDFSVSFSANRVLEDDTLSGDVKIIAYFINLLGPFIMVGFGIVPFIILYVSVRTQDNQRKPLLVILIADFLILLFYFYVFSSVFWFNEKPDGQDGIVLFMLPIICMGAAFVAVTISGFLKSSKA